MKARGPVNSDDEIEENISYVEESSKVNKQFETFSKSHYSHLFSLKIDEVTIDQSISTLQGNNDADYIEDVSIWTLSHKNIAMKPKLSKTWKQNDFFYSNYVKFSFYFFSIFFTVSFVLIWLWELEYSLLNYFNDNKQQKHIVWITLFSQRYRKIGSLNSWSMNPVVFLLEQTCALTLFFVFLFRLYSWKKNRNPSWNDFFNTNKTALICFNLFVWEKQIETTTLNAFSHLIRLFILAQTFSFIQILRKTNNKKEIPKICLFDLS